jgi:hypothetical protein
MTPKEKAKELMNRFNNEHNIELKEYIIYQSLEESKRCCLIAVDEIINHHSQEQGLYRIDTYYWQEVKKEIEKL